MIMIIIIILVLQLIKFRFDLISSLLCSVDKINILLILIIILLK